MEEKKHRDSARMKHHSIIDLQVLRNVETSYSMSTRWIWGYRNKMNNEDWL